MAEMPPPAPGSSPAPAAVPSTPTLPAPVPPRPKIRRKLEPGLPSSLVREKIREAERLMEAGEREVAFYLNELKTRKLYQDSNCKDFPEFIRKHTGLSQRKAGDLVRAGRALETLPALDAAFARGDAYWSAVRAAVAVATPQTDAAWAEYCSTHRVDEVESRVASSKPGEDPRKPRWGGRPRRYPYKFMAQPELHQAIESWCGILGKLEGRDVAIRDAIFEAVRQAIARAIADDGKDGTERKLPSSYRQVLLRCPDCRRDFAATSDGPEPIPEETARRLLEGAEVLDLTAFDAAPEPASLEAGGEPKLPVRGIVKTEVVVDPHPPSSAIHGADEPRVEHAANLSTGMPPVPPEERDRPNDAELRKRVLSRDGYFCVIPGCSGIAEQANHIEGREQGGPTTDENECALCIPHHVLCTAGEIKVSGTPRDLRISDKNDRPLVPRPGMRDPLVEIAISEKAPADPLAASTAAGSQPVEASPAGLPAPPAPPAQLPAEIDRAFWLAHRGLFDWSERRKMLTYHPERAAEGADDPPDPEPEGQPAGEGAAAKPEEFLGQKRVLENLQLALRAARLRGELPPHVLLAGPPGVGKTTLAKRVARDLDAKLHQAQGPSLQDLGAIAGILAELSRGDVLFIDEIHRLPSAMAECMYQALDEGALSLPVAQGSRTRLVKLHLEPFLLVAATTEESLLPAPLRSRFGIRERLDLYPREDLEKLAVSAGRSLGLQVTADAAATLARGARGTPRILLSHVARARDLAQLEESAISADVARRALACQGIDGFGLSETDRKLLRILLARDRPIGLRSLADLLGESPGTISQVYEPHLLREGYISRTWRGRAATEKARAWRFSPEDGGEEASAAG